MRIADEYMDRPSARPALTPGRHGRDVDHPLPLVRAVNDRAFVPSRHRAIVWTTDQWTLLPTQFVWHRYE